MRRAQADHRTRHLHRAQEAGAAHIRYCGSWMGFGFDEADEQKTLSLVELDAVGVARVTELPLVSPRPLRVVTGKLADLVAAGDSFIRDDLGCRVAVVLQGFSRSVPSSLAPGCDYSSLAR